MELVQKHKVLDNTNFSKKNTEVFSTGKQVLENETSLLSLAEEISSILYLLTLIDTVNLKDRQEVIEILKLAEENAVANYIKSISYSKYEELISTLSNKKK